MTKPYCTAPWNSLTVRENGMIKTCCNGSVDLLDINKESIFTVESTPALQTIKKNMLSQGIDQKNCSVCLQQERDNGVASLREHFETYYPDYDSDQLTPKFLDIRWNNTCNLGCLYCSPTFSSVWVDRLDSSTKKILPIRPYQDDLLSWILDRIKHVKEIMLVGGEPMLMKQNYELLKKLPEDCRISIITNLSYDLPSLPCWQQLLERGPNIVWSVSAENTKDKLEYVRSGISWSRFRKNIDILEKHWPGQISLNMVYNLFSAFDIDVTIKEFMDMGISKFVLQGLSKNRILQVGHLPFSLRSEAAKKLRAATQYHKQQIHPEDALLYQIRSSDEVLERLASIEEDLVLTWSEFQDNISWYDQWGSKSFKELWPELFDQLRVHLRE